MDEASLRREGNCRFASVRRPGWPAAPWRLAEQVRTAITAQEGVRPLGPLALLFDLPPSEPEPGEWACQVGTALIGLARPVDDIVVEDYRQLNALVRPHYEPLNGLGDTVHALRDEARARGWQVRPYWRLALWQRRTADGNAYPEPEVAVFVDP